jgi:hypothetical protein
MLFIAPSEVRAFKCKTLSIRAYQFASIAFEENPLNILVKDRFGISTVNESTLLEVDTWVYEAFEMKYLPK